MGGSSKHVIPVYLDGETQTVTQSDLDSSVANWDGLTSRVKIDSTENMTLKLGVPNHVGTIVFIEATNSSVGTYTIFDNGGNAGSDTSVATLEVTGDSATLVWDINRWRVISETDMASATGSAPVDSVNGETGAVVLDTSDVDEAAAGPFYAEAPVALGATLDLSSTTGVPRKGVRTGSANSTITVPADGPCDIEIFNINSLGTVSISSASNITLSKVSMSPITYTVGEQSITTLSNIGTFVEQTPATSFTLLNAKQGHVRICNDSTDGTKYVAIITAFE